MNAMAVGRVTTFRRHLAVAAPRGDDLAAPRSCMQMPSLAGDASAASSSVHDCDDINLQSARRGQCRFAAN